MDEEEPSELEMELFMQSAINEVTEKVATRLEEAADNHGVEHKVAPEIKADAKQIAKLLIPNKSPEVSFILIQVLTIMLRWAHEIAIIDMAENNPDMLEAIQEKIGGEDATQHALDVLEKRHQKSGEKYKSVSVKDKTMKVADLGDVMGGQSYN